MTSIWKLDWTISWQRDPVIDSVVLLEYKIYYLTRRRSVIEHNVWNPLVVLKGFHLTSGESHVELR